MVWLGPRTGLDYPSKGRRQCEQCQRDLIEFLSTASMWKEVQVVLDQGWRRFPSCSGWGWGCLDARNAEITQSRTGRSEDGRTKADEIDYQAMLGW